MIFLDESGQRWKRIKLSTAAAVSLVALPVVAVVGGSIAYHPTWGSLSLIHQVASVAGLESGNLASAYVQSPQSAAAKAKAAARVVTYAGASLVLASGSNPISSTAVTQPTSSATITSTSTSPKSTSPTGGNPVQNDFGQSHKLTR